MGALQSRRNRAMRQKALELRAQNPPSFNTIRRYEKLVFDGMWSHSSGMIFGDRKNNRCTETYPCHIFSEISEENGLEHVEESEIEKQEENSCTPISPNCQSSPDHLELKRWIGFRKRFHWNKPLIFVKWISPMKKKTNTTNFGQRDKQVFNSEDNKPGSTLPDIVIDNNNRLDGIDNELCKNDEDSIPGTSLSVRTV